MNIISYWELIGVYVLAVCLMITSALLDHLWARILGAGKIYRLFVTPGIVVHELSHALGCIITGAQVTDISFFDPEGGHVTHTRSRIPLIGPVVISIAPLFGITLFLFLLSLLFSWGLNCWFPGSYPGLFSLRAPLNLLGTIWDMFYVNLVERGAYWFLLFVYLAMSLGTCISPSKQDLRNSAVAIVVLSLISFGWLYLCNMIDWSAPVLSIVVRALTWALLTGLIFSLAGLVVTLPPALVRWLLKGR